MTDKEIIEIDGINVLECEHYQYKSLKDCEMRYPESGDCEIGLLNYLFDGNLDMEKLCKDNPNCYYKQLQKEKFENLNNRQMVESAENLIYENSELYKNLKEKEQECEQIKEKYEALKLENQEGYEIVAELKHECEELKEECEEHRSNAESYCKSYQYSCVVNGKITDKALKYKQALDEIAAHYQKVIKNITNYDDSYDASISIEALHNILDIINKAKGGV